MSKVYLIAEAGSVCDGSLGNMLELVKLVADAGFDAFKGQDHRWERFDSRMHPNQRVGAWEESRGRYYERTAFDAGDWNMIAAKCRDCGVDFIVSPFSVEAAKEQADRVTAFKVASGQVTNLELLRTLREIGKPAHLSSGMSTVDETAAALDILRPHVASVMQCTSEYPCPPERVGLNAIVDWCLPRGFSDHTMGMAASLAAITLGARVVERHVTPSRHLYGSDAAHSLEPDEFRQFVREVRELERMLANPVDKDALVKTPEMQRMREVFLAEG